jgi:hypothetical protein
VQAYRAARAAWAQLLPRADAYVPDITFGLDAHLRGHWRDRLPAMDRDIQRLARLLEQPLRPPQGDQDRIRQVLQRVLTRPERLRLPCRHQPPVSFRPGQSLPVALSLGPAHEQSRPVAVALYYRHVNQAENYHALAMHRRDDRWEALIPGAYLQSPYPLQYFFVFRDARGRAGLYPGFEATLCNRPYIVVRRA